MTGAEFEQAAIKLYGRRWKAPLCRRLRLHYTTLWRYQRLNEVPESIAEAMRSYLAEKNKGSDRESLRTDN
jgi:hypothetical protein